MPDGSTLFEAIEQSGLDDSETFIVHRGETCFVLLNAYPYTSGHMMVLPRRAVATLDGLDAAEHEELWATVRDAVAAVESAFSPGGVNVGLNLGPAAGAGVPGHLHVHVVPRWSGDTNFTTTTADLRVLPEALGDSWRRLREAWPA
ncbi:MAG: HIT domain-containing protein [Acidimicrobiales bacterium]|nr:HIT domain-containing protein [Acidimicrobiales bacterium]